MSFPLYYVNRCREALAQGGITLGWMYWEVSPGLRKTQERLERMVYAPKVETVMREIWEESNALLTTVLGLKEAELAEVLELSRETLK